MGGNSSDTYDPQYDLNGDGRVTAREKAHAQLAKTGLGSAINKIITKNDPEAEAPLTDQEIANQNVWKAYQKKQKKDDDVVPQYQTDFGGLFKLGGNDTVDPDHTKPQEGLGYYISGFKKWAFGGTGGNFIDHNEYGGGPHSVSRTKNRMKTMGIHLGEGAKKFQKFKPDTGPDPDAGLTADQRTHKRLRKKHLAELQTPEGVANLRAHSKLAQKNKKLFGPRHFGKDPISGEMGWILD